MNPLLPMMMALGLFFLFLVFTNYASSLKPPRRRTRKAH